MRQKTVHPPNCRIVDETPSRIVKFMRHQREVFEEYGFLLSVPLRTEEEKAGHRRYRKDWHRRWRAEHRDEQIKYLKEYHAKRKAERKAVRDEAREAKRAEVAAAEAARAEKRAAFEEKRRMVKEKYGFDLGVVPFEMSPEEAEARKRYAQDCRREDGRKRRKTPEYKARQEEYKRRRKEKERKEKERRARSLANLAKAREKQRELWEKQRVERLEAERREREAKAQAERLEKESRRREFIAEHGFDPYAKNLTPAQRKLKMSFLRRFAQIARSRNAAERRSKKAAEKAKRDAKRARAKELKEERRIARWEATKASWAVNKIARAETEEKARLEQEELDRQRMERQKAYIAARPERCDRSEPGASVESPDVATDHHASWLSESTSSDAKDSAAIPGMDDLDNESRMFERRTVYIGGEPFEEPLRFSFFASGDPDEFDWEAAERADAAALAEEARKERELREEAERELAEKRRIAKEVYGFTFGAKPATADEIAGFKRWVKDNAAKQQAIEREIEAQVDAVRSKVLAERREEDRLEREARSLDGFRENVVKLLDMCVRAETIRRFPNRKRRVALSEFKENFTVARNGVRNSIYRHLRSELELSGKSRSSEPADTNAAWNEKKSSFDVWMMDIARAEVDAVEADRKQKLAEHDAAKSRVIDAEKLARKLAAMPAEEAKHMKRGVLEARRREIKALYGFTLGVTPTTPAEIEGKRRYEEDMKSERRAANAARQAAYKQLLAELGFPADRKDWTPEQNELWRQRRAEVRYALAMAEETVVDPKAVVAAIAANEPNPDDAARLAEEAMAKREAARKERARTYFREYSRRRREQKLAEQQKTWTAEQWAKWEDRERRKTIKTGSATWFVDEVVKHIAETEGVSADFVMQRLVDTGGIMFLAKGAESMKESRKNKSAIVAAARAVAFYVDPDHAVLFPKGSIERRGRRSKAKVGN